MTSQLSIQDTFENVSFLRGGTFYPGHLYVTTRGMLWSPINSPLHDVESTARKRWHFSLLYIVPYVNLIFFKVSGVDNIIPRRNETLFEDIVTFRKITSRRHASKGNAVLRVHTVHGDVDLKSDTTVIDAIELKINEALGVKEDRIESPLNFYFYLDHTLVDQLFAPTPMGRVTELVKEVTRKVASEASAELTAAFISKIALSLKGEIGDKTVVKEQLSILHKLGLGVLYLYDQSQIESLSSLDLRRDPKPYQYIDNAIDRFAWLPKGKKDRRNTDEKLSLNCSLYELIDVSMLIDRGSVEHRSGFEALLQEDIPKIQGIAKVVSFDKGKHRLKLVPVFLAV